MKWIHPEIAGKRFVFGCIDDSFEDFTEEHCGGVSPEWILEDLRGTICLFHGEATPLHHDGAPIIWEIDTDHLIALYTVYEHTIYIGCITSKRTDVTFMSERVRELLG